MTHIKSAMQYPASFVFLLLYGALIPGCSIVSIVFLFARFGQIKGFNVYEILFCFSVAYIGFSASEVTMRGFDVFSRHVRTGDFDRILTRPRGTVLQVLCSGFEFVKTGRAVVPAVVLIFVLTRFNIEWDALKIVIVLLAVLSSFTLYAGLMILRASMCFWTIEALELSNIFIDGGKEVASYPISIYRKGFALFFTFVIPFACINYYPLLYLLGRSPNALAAAAPLVAVVFPVPCLFVWKIGVRRYESTGS